MRAAWPFFAVLLALVAMLTLIRPVARSGLAGAPELSSLQEESEGVSALTWVSELVPAILVAFGVPVLFAIASRGRRGWRSSVGLRVAAQVALGAGVVAALLFLAGAFGMLTGEPPSPAGLAWSLTYALSQALASVGAGALFFESLRRRAARRERVVSEPAISDGLLIALVPLMGMTWFVLVANV